MSAESIWATLRRRRREAADDRLGSAYERHVWALGNGLLDPDQPTEWSTAVADGEALDPSGSTGEDGQP